MKPWTLSVALVLASASPQVASAAPEPAAPTAETPAPETASPETPAPEAASPAVGDALLQAVVDRRVEIASSDGGTIVGTLESISDDAVIIVQSDGQLIEVPRGSIMGVRLVDQVPAPEGPNGSAALGTCTGDESCEEPRMCIEGACRVPPGYTDELRQEAQPRIEHGRRMLIAGASVAAAGILMMGIGFGISVRAENQYFSDSECGGFDEPSHCAALDGRLGNSFVAGVIGSVVLGIGAVVVITGGGMYGMGKNKLKRADRHDKQLDVAFEPTRRGFGVGLRGRF